MKKTGKKSIMVMQILLGLTLMVFLIWNLDLYKTWGRLKAVRWGWLGLSCLAMACVYYARALIIVLIAGHRTTIGAIRLFIYNVMASFFSGVLPTRIGGDVVKGLYLAEYFPSMSEAYAAMILQRVSGIVGTFLVSIIAGFFVLPLKQSLLLFGCALLLLLLAFVGLFFISKLMGRRRLYSTPLEGGDAFLTKVGKIIVAFAVYSGRKKKLAAAVVLSTPITVLGIFSTYFAAVAVGSAMTFPQILLASALSQLSAVITVTPGGVGIAEGTFVGAALALGISREESLPVAFLVRFVYVFISLIGGFIYLVHPLRLKRKVAGISERRKHV